MSNDPNEKHGEKIQPRRRGGRKNWIKTLEGAVGGELDLRARAKDKRPLEEVAVLRFRCTASRLPYSFSLKKNVSEDTYEVEQVLTELDASNAPTIGGNPPSQIEIDIDAVKDSRIMQCPHCGGRDGIVRCHCGKLSCHGGGRIENGEYIHVCPWCGSEGKLSGEFSTAKADNIPSSRAGTSKLGQGVSPRDALEAPDGS